MKNLYIIAGCNGAGKTTASMTVLPEVLDCQDQDILPIVDYWSLYENGNSMIPIVVNNKIIDERKYNIIKGLCQNRKE